MTFPSGGKHKVKTALYTEPVNLKNEELDLTNYPESQGQSPWSNLGVLLNGTWWQYHGSSLTGFKPRALTAKLHHAHEVIRNSRNAIHVNYSSKLHLEVKRKPYTGSHCCISLGSEELSLFPFLNMPKGGERYKCLGWFKTAIRVVQSCSTLHKQEERNPCRPEAQHEPYLHTMCWCTAVA